MAESKVDDCQTRAVGPYLLQRTLGKGQTGLVKMGTHCVTRKYVAVKIVNREKLSSTVLMKVEREIAIMKLINHPHVLGLYDVYENNTHLFLILELVSGGELFDYLVKKGRLSEREARKFFRQIVSAVDFCHKHSICHRDLKPENLLLDDNKNIKVADFGMASLQVGERLLETSCGSPHYACPEVIRGEQYDGRKADVWSCGVILFALLVGALPFDDDNLRVLLEKVKKGHFTIPPYVPEGAKDMLKGMIEVNPRKRMTLDQVMKHHWFQGEKDTTEPLPPTRETDVEIHHVSSKSDIDPDAFKSMNSLGCFKDKAALVQALLSPEVNEEKIIYSLLLDRKERQPSLEDETKAPSGDQFDPPRKRIDTRSSLPDLTSQRFRAQSIGSANLDQLPTSSSPRLGSVGAASAPHKYTPAGYYQYHTPPPPRAATRKTSYAGPDSALATATLDAPSPVPGSPWKRKISQTMKNFMGTPHFHRKKAPSSDGVPDTILEASAASPPVVKRSWFAHFRTEKEKEEIVIVYRDRSFTQLWTGVQNAFRIVNCTSQIATENSFKVKYEKSARHKNAPVLQRTVKLILSIAPTQTPSVPDVESSSSTDGPSFSVTFQHTSGPTRRFRRVCEKLQAAMFQPIATPPQSEDTDRPDHSPSISSDDTLGLHTEGSVNILLRTPDDDEKPNGSNKFLSEASDSGDETDEGV